MFIKSFSTENSATENGNILHSESYYQNKH